MKHTTIFLILFLTLSSFSALALPNQYYVINLEYSLSNITLKSIDVSPSFQPPNNPRGEYIAEVLSSDHHILNLTFFGFPTNLRSEIIDPKSGEIIGGFDRQLNESAITLYVPYFDNASQITIYNENLTVKASINVSRFSQINNQINKNQENILNKPQQIDIEDKTSSTLLYALIAAAVLLVIIVVVLVLLTHKKDKD